MYVYEEMTFLMFSYHRFCKQFNNNQGFSLFSFFYLFFFLNLYSYLSSYKDKVGNNVFHFTVKRFCAIVKVSSQEFIKHFNHMAP